MNKLIAATLAAALFAANPLAVSASDGIMQGSTPVCPTPEEARAIWEVLVTGRFQRALDMVNDSECFLAEGRDPYFGGTYKGDVAQLENVYHNAKLYEGWYTLPGGMRCKVDCPPGVLLYHH